ncbi:hypothetical protein LOCC1_G007270 [Lachnellula occidentalis]|uniref:Uncharacterized protein n=1 Tax=Lachnellula occidentalis TaxID=215460 RepID=A0A8H8RK70_9HELO|nr:hypothetical protein LOCC1_G007270 [Lachnellula occidentalis]
MPPLPAPTDIWTPDVIATVVYRIIMVIVSIAFIWRAYRQPVRAVDDEHVVGIILPNTSTRTASASSRGSSSELSSSSKSMMHDFMTAQVESILQSALGIGDVGNDTPPPAVRDIRKSTSSTAGSSTSASSIKAAHKVDHDTMDRSDTFRVEKT